MKLYFAIIEPQNHGRGPTSELTGVGITYCRLVPISLVLRDFSPKIGGVFDVYLVVDTALCR